jgi:hypothetical protein
MQTAVGMIAPSLGPLTSPPEQWCVSGGRGQATAVAAVSTSRGWRGGTILPRCIGRNVGQGRLRRSAQSSVLRK